MQGQTDEPKRNWLDIPVIALMGANAVPLLGVLFLKWDAFAILLLYWAENFIVGFYSILRIAFVRTRKPVEHLRKLFFIPFFVIHYGGFMAGHGFFLLFFFRKTPAQMLKRMSQTSWPCFLEVIQELLHVTRQAYAVLPPGARPVLVGLFLSHGISFLYNYLLKREYAVDDPRTLMFEPYTRVIVMHVAIIFGGFIAMALGCPVGLVVALVIVKTVIDVKMHLHSHRKKALAAESKTWPFAGPNT